MVPCEDAGALRPRLVVALAEAVGQVARRRRHVHREARDAVEELGAREDLDHGLCAPVRLVLGERDVVRRHLAREAELEEVKASKEAELAEMRAEMEEVQARLGKCCHWF